MLGSGLSMEWMRRHLISLDLENQPEDSGRIIAFYRQWLKANRKDTDGVIVSGYLKQFLDACRAENVNIPDELAVISIGLLSKPYDKFEYLDNNFPGHFQYALELLEDRFRSDHITPGSWYFCPPRGIVPCSKVLNHKTDRKERNE